MYKDIESECHLEKIKNHALTTKSIRKRMDGEGVFLIGRIVEDTKRLLVTLSLNARKWLRYISDGDTTKWPNVSTGDAAEDGLVMHAKLV